MINLLFSLLFSGRLFLPGPAVPGDISIAYGLESALDLYLDEWDPSTLKRLVVSLKEQTMYLFHQHTLLAVFSVSTGRDNFTPEGKFRIYYKKARVRYGSGDGMPFWMEFKPKFGIHGLPFDATGLEAGLEDLGKPVSAGCIRLNTVDAGLLYHTTPRHSLLIIQENPPSY